MKYLIAVLVVVMSVVAWADSFKKIHVKDLSQWLSKDSANVAIFDANNDKTRTKNGVIPGAKILSSYDSYDVAKELPADHAKKLVFYCANTQCSASHEAAEKASTAGYTDVSVMVDGIEGWKKAGKTTQPYTKTSS